MNKAPAFDFSKLVPGFDFLQKFSGAQAATGAPSVSSWVTPTLDPKELERRIQDLKTVQFWLEQNTQAMSATIQALEVQRMTLATLQGMNVSMNELADALKVKPAAAPAQASEAQAPSKPKPKRKPASKATEPADQADQAGGADPMAWWGALTQQFQTIASDAMKDMQAKAQAAQAQSNQTATPVAPASTARKARRASKTSTPTKRN